MPMYEFECAACGLVFEELAPFDAKVAACPKCGCQEAAKLVSMPMPLKKNPFPFKISPPRPGVKPRKN